MVHNISLAPDLFDAVARGAKTAILLGYDHKFDKLDVLRLVETTAEGSPAATGREIAFRVTYVERGNDIVLLSGVIVEQNKKPLGDLLNHDLNTFIKESETEVVLGAQAASTQ